MSGHFKQDLPSTDARKLESFKPVILHRIYLLNINHHEEFSSFGEFHKINLQNTVKTNFWYVFYGNLSS